jgi:hypothetical protein
MRRDVIKTLRSTGSAGVLVAATLAALTLAGSLGGCASSGRNDGGRHSDIQGDLSPELDTLTLRPIDFDNRMYYTWDTNGRMFWGDLLKASYQDRPSRLVNAPTPY